MNSIKHATLVLMSSLLVVLLLLPSGAYAHRVNVFAWQEGDTVHTQSSANRGKPVINAAIVVSDAAGKVLLRGTTDTQGMFSFPRPAPGALKIELLAGPGHKGVWVLEDETEAEGPSPGGPAEEPQPGQQPVAFLSQTSAPVSAAQISEMVDTVVVRRLAPLQAMIAENYTQGPGIREILGGLGYILGLMGLGAFFHYRRKVAELEGEKI